MFAINLFHCKWVMILKYCFFTIKDFGISSNVVSLHNTTGLYIPAFNFIGTFVIELGHISSFSLHLGRISSLTNAGGILACAMKEVMNHWDKDSVPFLSFMLEVNRHLCGISRKISSDEQSSVQAMDEIGVEERSDPEDVGTNITNTEGENIAETVFNRLMENVQVCDAKAEDGYMNVLDYKPCASIVHTLTKDIVFRKCQVQPRNPSKRRKRHRNPNEALCASNNEKGDMI